MENQQLTTIYIVRHGETRANLEEIVSGHFDSPLTEKGEEQARQRAQDLKKVHFDAIFSSDLIRAKRTAEIISLDRQLELYTTKLLRERFFGKWEGKPVSEFVDKNKHLFELEKKLTEEQRHDFKIDFEYESNKEIANRMLTFLREIAVTFFGKTVLVISHGSIMRSTLMRLGFAKTDELPAGAIENTGYVVLESDGIDFFVKETKGVEKTKV